MELEISKWYSLGAHPNFTGCSVQAERQTLSLLLLCITAFFLNCGLKPAHAKSRKRLAGRDFKFRTTIETKVRHHLAHASAGFTVSHGPVSGWCRKRHLILDMGDIQYPAVSQYTR